MQMDSILMCDWQCARKNDILYLYTGCKLSLYNSLVYIFGVWFFSTVVDMLYKGVTCFGFYIPEPEKKIDNNNILGFVSFIEKKILYQYHQPMHIKVFRLKVPI